MGDSNGQGNGDGDQENQTIKVGEKDYSIDDVSNLVANVKANSEKVEAAAKVATAAESYGMSVEEFLEQSVGSFSVIGDLIEKGTINKDGSLVEKKVVTKPDGDDDPLDDLLDLENNKRKKGDPGMEAMIKINERLDKLDGKMDETQDLQTSMIRSGWQDKIQAEHKNLNADDVNKVFGAAMAARKQGKPGDLMELAKTASEAKAGVTQDVEKEFAKTHGLDYEKLTEKKDENSLNEQDSKGTPGIKLRIKEGFKDGQKMTLEQASAGAEEYFKNQFESG